MKTTVKHFTLIFLFFGLLLMDGMVKAQLPPTIYRIKEWDTAVDPPSPTQTILTAPSVSPAFKEALAPTYAVPVLKSTGRLLQRPLTVELWAKIDAVDYYSVLVAQGPKDTSRYWEFYVEAGSGKPCVYLPENPAGDHFVASEGIADGKWHYLTLILGEDEVQIFSDGRLVAQGSYDRSKDEVNEEITDLSIGGRANHSLNFGGTLDELRITAGLPEKPISPETVPSAPLDVNEETLLLIHFDQVSTENSKKDQAADRLSGDALISPRDAVISPEEVRSFSDLNLPAEDAKIKLEGKLTETSGTEVTLHNERIERLFPTGGMELTVPPGDKPAKNVPMKRIAKADFDARVQKLNLTTIASDDFRDGVFAFWGETYCDLEDRISGKTPLPRGAADQVYDETALVADGEKYPVEMVLRQAKAALDALENVEPEEEDAAEIFDQKRNDLSHDWDILNAAVKQNLSGDAQNDETIAATRTTDYFLASALKRQILFLNPELDSLNRILFLARACYAGSRLTNQWNQDRIGGHFATQVYGFNTIHGGGLFTLSDWREKNPSIKNLLEGKKVTGTSICSRLAGRELDYGSFYAPDVDFDGRSVYFSHCGSQEHRWIWTPDTTWNIFKLTVDESGHPDELTQLTDSAYNDFDVCCLPSGRLVFESERRGGFIRCFGEGADLRVTTSVLHGMKKDGSDLYPLSFFETGEWQPSVDNQGLLVYTRWDYTDRENCLGSTFWTCAPDGRNPRSPHGNYPFPWHTFEDNTHGDHRFGNCPDAPSALPMTEMQIRAIPDSHRYVFTAAPHHGETFGSICVLDLREKNDNHMSQIRRVTPYFPFPESEMDGRSQYRYGSPWPVNEDLFLCNNWEDLILLDRFGNEELLCEREILPIGYDPRLRLTDPIPLSPRFKPTTIPQQTAQGEDFANLNQTATIGVVNVNITDQPLPEDRPVKRLRVLQVIPKANPWMDTPWIGYATENTPRIPLGTVPVEPDGSAYFEAPAGKQLLFQILDEENRAIQTMRAVAYVHPGEKLICVGCHESTDESVENQPTTAMPTAFSRKPSKLEPECGPIEPMNFYRFVQPVFEKSCVPCHTEEGKGPTEMGFEDMRPWVYYFSGGMRGQTVTNGDHGGSRSRPGRVGASESKLGKILFDENHMETVSEEDRHKIILWLDANALRLGAFQNEKEQMEGKLVWPILDTEPCELYDPHKTEP